MWFEFCTAFLFYAAVLFIPAYYLLSALEMDQRISVSMAFPISTFLYALSGILLFCFGISSNPVTAILPWVFVLFILGFAVRRKKGQKPLENAMFSKASIPLAYIIIGVVITTVIFVAPLDGPTAFFQDGTDNYYHLNAVRSLAQSGNMSCLSMSIFEHSVNATSLPAFYPGEWHILAALCMQAFRIEPTICINALNALLIAVVFPLSVYSFLVSIDANNDRLHVAGSVTALSVCICPWEFLIWGPLYPNLLGLVFIFSVSSSFILLLSSRFKNLVTILVLFIVGCCAIALAQPNCIITMGVLLAPFLISNLHARFKSRSLPAVLLSSLITLAIVLFWVICRISPVFSGVAGFYWPPISDFQTAVLETLKLAMMFHPAQWIVVICVVFGVIQLVQKHQNRWLCLPPIFFAVSYAVCISSDGMLRTYLSGFWYNDFYRVACMYGLCFIPLVSYGFAFVCDAVESQVAKKINKPIRLKAQRYLRAAVMLGFAVICFRPSGTYPIFGYNASSFGFLSDTIRYQYTFYTPTASLTKSGEDFLKEVAAITGTGSLVINDPNDGSVYAYGLNNINTYFRRFFVPTNNESATLIRENLSHLSTDPDVQRVVNTIGAEYVLVLDSEEGNPDGIKYYDFYNRDEWRGIHDIDENTPGFKLLLAKDNMRLYQIEQ